MCVGGLLSHFCLTNAYRHGDATMVVPLDFLRIPLIALVGGGGVNGGSIEVNGQFFTWGSFLNQVITFVLTAAVVYFVIVLPMKALVERRKRGEEAGPVAPTQVELLVEIRDLLRTQQGMGAGPDPSGPGTTSLPGQL